MTMSCTINSQLLPAFEEITNKPEGICPVDWAMGVADTARMNNCGKSVMCRDGMNQIYTIIRDITMEKGQSEDIALLKDICTVIKMSEGCIIAQKSAERIEESLMRYSDEWDIHIRRRRCTALVCKRYYTIHVQPEKCRGSGECIRACPAGAISGGAGLISVIHNEKCTRCGACMAVCPSGAILKAGAVKPKVPETPIPIESVPSGEEGEGASRRRKRKSEE